MLKSPGEKRLAGGRRLWPCQGPRLQVEVACGQQKPRQQPAWWTRRQPRRRKALETRRRRQHVDQETGKHAGGWALPWCAGGVGWSQKHLSKPQKTPQKTPFLLYVFLRRYSTSSYGPLSGGLPPQTACPEGVPRAPRVLRHCRDRDRDRLHLRATQRTSSTLPQRSSAGRTPSVQPFPSVFGPALAPGPDQRGTVLSATFHGIPRICVARAAVSFAPLWATEAEGAN